jgi:hypothetical protein
MLAPLVNELAFYLGLSPSPTTPPQGTRTAGWVEAALRFFVHRLGLDPFDPLWFRYVTGIDFHREVVEKDLSSGTKLMTWEARPAGRPKPFRYFAARGSSPTRLGTTFPSYQYVEYEVIGRVPALTSHASGIRFDEWDMVSRLGGGIQYIVPSSVVPAYIRHERVGTLV